LGSGWAVMMRVPPLRSVRGRSRGRGAAGGSRGRRAAPREGLLAGLGRVQALTAGIGHGQQADEDRRGTGLGRGPLPPAAGFVDVGELLWGLAVHGRGPSGSVTGWTGPVPPRSGLISLHRSVSLSSRSSSRYCRLTVSSVLSRFSVTSTRRVSRPCR